MRSRMPNLLIMGLMAVIVAVGLAGPADAAGATGPTAPTRHTVGPIVVRTAAGTLTYQFTPLDDRAVAAARATAARQARNTVGQSLSASGCNQEVCISIIGSSNFVSEWDTHAFTESAMCTWPDFYINNGIVYPGDVICGDGAGVFSAFWQANRYFPSPSLACNTWFNIPGKPCETIRR